MFGFIRRLFSDPLLGLLAVASLGIVAALIRSQFLENRERRRQGALREKQRQQLDKGQSQQG